jgi:recombination protein RecR
MPHPDPIENLIKALSRLPGLGRRSAERIALRLAQNPGRRVEDLVTALQDVQKTMTGCELCGGLTTRTQNPCGWCTDRSRDDSLLCVVETSSDLLLIEHSGGFKGRYFCLNARLSPARGEGVDDLQLPKLLSRIDALDPKEVILALNTDVESDATASFLADVLHQKQVKVSRLAFGIPAGSGLAYADDLTLTRALSGRQEID